ncbi:MAG: hypothetical protein QNJ91_13665 [Gammaproteobacteria bacterium]|nr:hypothetical protein [Gammaproteobacteria bacterium]
MSAARMMLLCIGLSVAGTAAHASLIPFISELHYDNAGRDVGEFVAVTGPVGFDFDGWQVELYNGANGRRYDASAVSAAPHGSSDGLIEIGVVFAALQNGPDAVALVSDQGSVVDFIAYEQAVTASDGPAAGLTARLIDAFESASTAVGLSLQRVGTLDRESWLLATASPGVVNDGLRRGVIVAAGNAPLPGVAVVLLWTAGWLGMAAARRRGVG